MRQGLELTSKRCPGTLPLASKWQVPQTAEVGRIECGVVLVWQSWHEIRWSWGEASYDATTAGKLVLWQEVHWAVR